MSEVADVDVMEKALQSALCIMPSELAYELLGCDFGRVFGVTSEDIPCVKASVSKICLHAVHGSRVVKVCADHKMWLDASCPLITRYSEE